MSESINGRLEKLFLEELPESRSSLVDIILRTKKVLRHSRAPTPLCACLDTVRWRLDVFLAFAIQSSDYVKWACQVKQHASTVLQHPKLVQSALLPRAISKAEHSEVLLASCYDSFIQYQPLRSECSRILFVVVQVLL